MRLVQNDVSLPSATVVAESNVFTSVCHSVHREVHAWLGWGACMAGGVHGSWGACVASGGRVWQVGGMHGKGACVVGEMAIAADGTHPTGMHSCLGFVDTCQECHRFSYRLRVGSMEYHDAVCT